MMRVIIACERCGAERLVEEHDQRDLCYGLMASALALHAANKSTGDGSAHCDHRIVIRDFDFPRYPTRQLRIECLAAGCRERAVPTVFETMCPIELVGALAVVFHAAHEGHPLRLEWNGLSWQSPLAK